MAVNRDKFSEPSPRDSHVSALVDGRVYVWGGRTRPAEDDAATINCFQPLWESWSQSDCIGPTPPGLLFAACASAGHHFYVYGGMDEQNRYYSCLHQLDLRTNTWRIISSDHDGPRRRQGCGLTVYDSSSNLLLIGGRDKDRNDTDEIHTINLKEGEEEGAMSISSHIHTRGFQLTSGHIGLGRIHIQRTSRGGFEF